MLKTGLLTPIEKYLKFEKCAQIGANLWGPNSLNWRLYRCPPSSFQNRYVISIGDINKTGF